MSRNYSQNSSICLPQNIHHAHNTLLKAPNIICQLFIIKQIITKTF